MKSPEDPEEQIDGQEDEQDKKPVECLPDFKSLYAQNFLKVYPEENVDTFYPTYWLTFLLIGRAAGKDVRPSLEVGIYVKYILFKYIL